MDGVIVGCSDLRAVAWVLGNLLNGAAHELRSRDLVCQVLLSDSSLLRNADLSQAINP